MISDMHRAKNVFGELTFGEYWNLVGCHAAAARVNRSKRLVTRFEPEAKAVKFFFDMDEDGGQTYFSMPLECRVRVVGNKVTTVEAGRGRTSIEFFELSPLEFDSDR